jgi:MFS superfamily sulfate permease-like transporter
MKTKTMTNSRVLAEQHGFKDSKWMYVAYYVPCLIWIRQYNWSWLKGDFTAAITLASMYLPMALSYADSLAHVTPINGLYAFVFNPFIYGILGSCPQMVVGPEAAGSLLIGSIVKSSIDLGRGEDDNAVMHAQVAGVAVGMAGATVFIMGMFRLGFLDSVLSRPFLRGFISAIGVVIFIDQLIPVLGLSPVAAVTPGVGHGSSVDKLTFLFTHLNDIHKLSAIVGIVSFVVIMVLRYVPQIPIL